MSDSVRPHRRQPTRLPCPWDSPGKNTGVGCHVLLQCMKVKSESEVAQSCPTLSDPMNCSPPGSSVHGIFQAKVLEWGAVAFSTSLPSSSQLSITRARDSRVYCAPYIRAQGLRTVLQTSDNSWTSVGGPFASIPDATFSLSTFVSGMREISDVF